MKGVEARTIAAALPVQGADDRSSLSGIRFGGAVAGRLIVVSGRYGHKKSKGAPLYCVSRSITPYSITLEVGARIAVGELVIVQLGDLGSISGTVLKRDLMGLTISINATIPERYRLAGTIAWMRERRLKNLPDQRSAPRRRPTNPASTVIFENGARVLCHVLNYSTTGVAVLAQTTPPEVGTPLAVGSVVGRVARILPEGGFAVRFITPLAADEAEAAICRLW